MRRFFYTFIVIVAIGGLVLFSLFWLGKNNSGPSLVFEGPKEVLVGVPFTLEVGVGNESDQVLQDVRVSLSLPAGIVFVGRDSEESLFSKKIGNLGTGSLTGEVFELMVVKGEKKEEKTIDVSVDYSPEFLGSRFKKDEQWKLRVSGPAVELTAQAPEKTASGEKIELAIAYKNVSESDLDDLMLEIEYPPAFQYETATLKPDEGENKWKLGGLHAGSENKFIVIGKLIGPENSFFSFKTRLNVEKEGKLYVVNEEITNVTIKIAPLSLTILANGVSDYIAELGDTIKYTINYNYLDESAVPEHATIKTKLSGQMFEFNGAGDQEQTLSLDNLAVSGSVVFEAKVKNSYPIKRLGDRNFLLTAEAQMDDGRHIGVAKLESKVAGKIDLDAQAFFRDADSGVVNSGPFPPQSGQTTSYTIHWLVTNYSTDIKNLIVRATLPPYANFVEAIQEDGDKLSYDASKREVVWTAGRVSATRGVVSQPLEAIFKINAAPPESFIGQYLPLLNESRADAVDDFTNLPLTDGDSALTTELPDDPTVGKEGRVVK